LEDGGGLLRTEQEDKRSLLQPKWGKTEPVVHSQKDDDTGEKRGKPSRDMENAPERHPLAGGLKDPRDN